MNATLPIAAGACRENLSSHEIQGTGGTRITQEIFESRGCVTSVERLVAPANATSASLLKDLERAGQNVPRVGRPVRRVLIASLAYVYPRGGEPLSCVYSAVLEDGHQLGITDEEESLRPCELLPEELPAVVKTPRGRLSTKTLAWLSPREVWLMRKEVVPPCWPMVCAVGAPLFFRTADGPFRFVNAYQLALQQKEDRHE